MKRAFLMLSTLMACAVVCAPLWAQAPKVEYIKAEPMANKLHGQLKPCPTGAWTIPGLTWSAEVAVQHGITEGYYRAEGLDVTLEIQNNPVIQGQAVIDGKYPVFRGTVSQCLGFAEYLAQQNIECVGLYHYTFSAGGDQVIWISTEIKRFRDLKGKTGVMQLYAPHAELFYKGVKDDSLAISDVNIRYTAEITVTEPNAAGFYVDAASAFQYDTTNLYAALISPDGAVMTAKGAEARKNAVLGISSLQGDKIIADMVIAPRPWYEANKQKYLDFVQGTQISQESLEALRKNAATDPRWKKLLEDCAKLLLGDVTKTADIEGLLADSRQMGYLGNHAFLTGEGTSRSLTALCAEYAPLLVEAGVLKNANITIKPAPWDYAALREGLKNPDEPLSPEVEYDPLATARYVEGLIGESMSFTDDPNTKFMKEIFFGKDQSDFPVEQYQADFDKFLDLIESYGGLGVSVIGYADPTPVPKLERQIRAERDPEKKRKLQAQLNRYPQDMKNLSYRRAKSVIEALAAYAKTKGVALEITHLNPVGMGIRDPKYPVPTTEQEWEENRRVVLLLQATNLGESDKFEPPQP